MRRNTWTPWKPETGIAVASIPWLDDEDLGFPATRRALSEPNGLLAVGGDLSLGRLLEAYRHGIFPWYEDDQPILWWSPNPRCVVFPDDFKPARSLRRRLKKQDFQIRVDTDFPAVINACQTRDGLEGTWITAEMKAAYTTLHLAGFAHSLECYMDGELAGGLYGIALGRMFFGESMFHYQTDASKLAFCGLIHLLHGQGFPLVDCQVPNPHLFSLGAVEIDRREFETRMQAALAQPAVDWDLLRGELDLSDSDWIG